MKEAVTKETKENVRSGVPMSEQSYKEWQQAFIDIEESINNLNTRRPVCRKQ